VSPASRARMLDEATILRCEETSWREQRDYVADACAGCGLPFWVHTVRGRPNVYCCDPCRFRAADRRKRRARTEGVA
jgi:predicted RNA methylase